MEDLHVVDNRPASRYELRAGDDVVGSIVYARRDDTVTLVHTEVDEKLEGHGLGGRLVRGALDDIRARGLRMRPVCPFVRSYLARHPEAA